MGDYKRCGCGKRSAHVDVCDTGVRFECCGTARCCMLAPPAYGGWTTEPLLAAPAPTPDPRPITCAACDELPAAPAVHFDVCDAEGRREPCCGGIDCCGLTAGYARDWRIEPLVPTPGPRDAEIERLRADRDGLVATLVRVFGWSDVSCLHAALHVENAVRNLQATLATEHAETERLRGLYGWLTDEVRKLAHEGDWGHGRTHEQLLSDVRRKIDGGAAEIAALRERNAELEAAVDDTLHHGGNALFPAGISGEPAAPAAVARTRDALARLAEARRGGTSALDALRAEDKARSSELEAQVRTLRQAVSLIVSDIRVKHAHYEDAHLNPKPKRPIPVDEANWLRTLEHALAGDAEAIENTIEARAEIATEAALADQKTRVLNDVRARVEVLPRSPVDHAPPMVVLAQVLAAIDAAREGT